MAPPPEYDKEPKAPDKSITNISTDDSKVIYNHIKEQSINTDHKTATISGSVEAENKHVETLDDGQLRALLDEAITYKCPKDREGKSSLFKELLEEVEQDEQACEAAARGLGAGRGARRARGRREHHSSLQDLVAAMAGEAAPRRGRAHGHSHVHATPSTGTVSARTHHGGSLPSGVDTSFLLSEDSGLGVGGSRGGYLATVRCVNPPPLAERRVSAGDANPPQPPAPPAHDGQLDVLSRRSKPMFPMTYTARATLEIGSGSVCSGRAVTTTTASNQVKLMNALHVNTVIAREGDTARTSRSNFECGGGSGDPRGPTSTPGRCSKAQSFSCGTGNSDEIFSRCDDADVWMRSVNHWYDSLNRYTVRAPTSYGGANNVISSLDESKSVTNEINIFDNNIEKVKSEFNVSNVKDTRGVNDINISTNREYESYMINKSKEKRKCDNNKSEQDTFSNTESDISLRKIYRERVGDNLIAPNKLELNPKNFRSLTIGEPIVASQNSGNDITKRDKKTNKHNNSKLSKKKLKNIKKTQETLDLKMKEDIKNIEHMSEETKVEYLSVKGIENDSNINDHDEENILEPESPRIKETINDLELIEMPSSDAIRTISDPFVEFATRQQKLIKILEINNNDDDISNHQNNYDSLNKASVRMNHEVNCKSSNLEKYEQPDMNITRKILKPITPIRKEFDNNVTGDDFMIAELPNNAYILLTLPKSFLTSSVNKNKQSLKITEVLNNAYTNNTAEDSNKSTTQKKNRKKLKQPQQSGNTTKDGVNKNVLKMLLYSENPEKALSVKKKLSTYKDKEVDSAIPFSCITTPEVVASCNTTSSTCQSAVAVDPKPLQLGSCYRTLACLTGGMWTSAQCEPETAPPPAPPDLPASSSHQPRSVISSSFNGLPLSRPSYGAAASGDEYKKSLDENGNAVQGFGSSLASSGQHKKPRRKKSSKNETVIKSHQIDGYQGNKDLNEVLRFIESNAEGARAPKLRAKHKDDGEDKGGKKRSTERRKDKESKIKRATSLEELSRTKLEDLTDKPRGTTGRRDAPAKPERRSWGDDARALLAESEPPDAPPELTDFQTVTKRRRPRRRADEPERDAGPPRRVRAPSPGAERAPPSAPSSAPSAPPSDRSNDSNDDMDSVHSLPPDATASQMPNTTHAPAPPPPPLPPSHASYAEIARTRHNIPDLIESCNFYGEGQSEPAAGTVGTTSGDAEQYPALATRRGRDKPGGGGARAPRKERAEPPDETPPAPDVVADRRPAVILLAAGARPRDMDGVTFGFDINEQLLGSAAARRCDLLQLGGVAVRAGGAALRYVPPAPPADDAPLLRIVDYVGAAWEDAVRGGSKVRYFSE